MHPALKSLLDLQSVDLRLAELRAIVAGFPRRLKELDDRVEAARRQLASSKEAHTNALKERKKFELDVEQWKERARKYRDQSAAVKTNEAFKALQHEISNAEAEIVKAEDRLLEQMVAGEEFERQVKTAEGAVKEAQSETQAERRRIEAEQAEAQNALEAAQAVRERALAPVSEDLRTLYERIARRHNGIGLAEARNEMCMLCGMRVLPHVFQELLRENAEEVHQCETCGRILYVAVAPAAAPARDGAASTASEG